MIGNTLNQDDLLRVDHINGEVIGYSNTYHYSFFKAVLDQFPHIRDILILGVYHSRDICFLCDILNRYHPDRDVKIVGVDKFSDTPCEDWPESKRDKNWADAGFGKAPSLADACENLSKLKFLNRVSLIKAGDENFLINPPQFDFIYLDTSHDYATVTRQLAQIRNACRGPETVIAGDDFSDEGTWGVKSAVQHGFSSFELWCDWIWVSDASRLK